MATIKTNLEEMLKSQGPIVLELGCGPRKSPGRIGVDILDLPGVDVVANLDQGLGFLPDQSVDLIIANSLFEHINNLPLLIKETIRVLRPEGECRIFVPHFSNPYFYSDYTHRIFFGLYTMYYFSDYELQLRRKVPNFYQDIRLKVKSIELIFNSPFRSRRFIKRFLGWVFNSSNFMKEFYEENLCYIFPCYGMNIVYSRADDS